MLPEHGSFCAPPCNAKNGGSFGAAHEVAVIIAPGRGRRLGSCEDAGCLAESDPVLGQVIDPHVLAGPDPKLDVEGLGLV
jgi:hypothetical protein